MRPGVRLEEFPHRIGSPVCLGRDANGVARMRHVMAEGDFGAAWEKISRGIVLKDKRASRPREAPPAHGRGVAWSRCCSRGRGRGR